MRTTTLLLTTAALLAAAPLGAQTTAFAVGGGRATVRIEAALTIPAYLRATETAAFVETHKGNGFTELLATYTVRGNTRWTLEAAQIPAGVTVLDERADWTGTDAIVGRGDATNGTTILVRVRVTDGTAADWQQALRLEAVRQF